MRTALTIVLTFTLVLGLASLASAQDGARDRGEYRPDTEFDFEDDIVTGDNDTPWGAWLGGRPRSRRETLIQARMHFVNEMMKSVERL